MTREELNDSLIAKYKSELPFINEKFSKMGVDPTKISDEVKMGAFDIYW